LRVGIIQSCYIPWRGYFDFIASVDLFVFYDDVQYSKGSWRNRNKIKTPKGSEWLTVPVIHRELSQKICDTRIDHSGNWKQQQIRMWKESYRDAPCRTEADKLFSQIEDLDDVTISDLNIRLTKSICSHLGIGTPTRLSSEFSLQGTQTDRLINLLKQLGATIYLSGPSAEAYLDKSAFEKNRIGLEYKSYDYEAYPQQWGAFEGAVTILDLIANCGAASTRYLRSRSADIVVVPAS
jgi:hypothetical protein